MEREAVHRELTAVFRNVFDNVALEIANETTAKDIATWDSLNHINLIIATEQRFHVKFSTAEIARLANVGQFIDLILGKLSR